MSAIFGRRLAVLALAALGLAASSYVPWEELAKGDAIFGAATRTALLDGHEVHYETPTHELLAALETQPEPMALRHLAEARMRLGDRAGALRALESWAQSTDGGPAAWAEAARWAHERDDDTFAYRAAANALPGLDPDARLALARERIAWAEAKPEKVDVLALHRELVALTPNDARAAERFLRLLVRDHKPAEALAALTAMPAALLDAERRALVASLAHAEKQEWPEALRVLDDEVESLRSRDALRAFAARVAKAAPAAPEEWRGKLTAGFDAHALVRLVAYFAGQGRGDAALAVLRQVDRRNGNTLGRAGWLSLTRGYDTIDAGPEAFRARLAAASGASATEQVEDLAALADQALRAGGRPLAWGSYSDEPYAWVARLDETPGFWTGGLSLLLTGTDWTEAFARLASDSVRVRTFAAARALVGELAKRAPAHAALPRLRLAIMERHVEQGDGAAALALLPALEAGESALADRARRTALLAMRLTKAPLDAELRLYRARLAALAADGAVPAWDLPPHTYDDVDDQLPSAEPPDSYRNVLEDALARADYLDPSHEASVALMLGEMDRLPRAEALWLQLAARLEQWNLDDELAPRYEKAIAAFDDASWWSKLARYYARRKRTAELQALADKLVARFRGSDIFARSDADNSLQMPLPAPAPAPGARVRLVRFADFVRLRALERFPHSPTVYREAASRLLRRNGFDSYEALLAERRYAVLFVDPGERERWFAAAMKRGDLESRLEALEKSDAHDPVRDLLLYEGWSRLSLFEKAHAAADRLSAAYPGEETLARAALSLHRSLAPLAPAHAAAAAALVARTAPALPDPAPLWTSLGELHEDIGRGDLALADWQHLPDGAGEVGPKADLLSALLWDYGHTAEALAAIEAARATLQQPRLLAFEAGVLREERGDLRGAVREYLQSSLPGDVACFCSAFDEDQRSLRRLVQLLGRDQTRTTILAAIDKLQPGREADERSLAALFPLGTIVNTTPGLEWDVDDWIDAADLPHDPVGREQRQAAMAAARGAHEAGTLAARQHLVAQANAFIAGASSTAFLDRAAALVAGIATQSLSRDQHVAFRAAVLARRAELAPTADDRVRLELERAQLLAAAGRDGEAAAAWRALAARLPAMGETPLRLRTEAARAVWLERSQGVAVAAAEWRKLGERHPWSLGLLDDRVSFLNRIGRGAEARAVLEAAATSAASGHRQDLLARLTRESLAASDLARAERAAAALLEAANAASDGDDAAGARLGALRLLARLKLRADPHADLLAMAAAEEPRFAAERRPYLWAELAGAAGDENQPAAAMALYIEALNRRVERPWLAAAARAAQRGGRMDELLQHFERQQQRSPRDVRWAVAVRELRLANHDLDGAIAMAQAAAAVRPERESLWREAADLLVRAGRSADAARFLEGWNRPRPADEAVAGWRSSLYARGGDAASALAVERAALDAYRKARVAPDESQDEASARAARAARRLMDAGLPKEAWNLLAPGGKAAGVASELGSDAAARLALMNDSVLSLLVAKAGDSDHRLAVARALQEYARPEQLQEFEEWVMKRLYDTPPGNVAALRQWWPAIEEAGVAAHLRTVIARRMAAASPPGSPWREQPGEAFIASAANVVVTDTGHGYVFGAPDFAALWVRDLAHRDRPTELAAFLRPRVQALLAQAASPAADNLKERVPWTAWLDDPVVIETFVRGVAADPAFVSELAPTFIDDKRFARFLRLGARGWRLGPLVAQLSPADRDAFLKTTAAGRAVASLVGSRTAFTDGDPVLAALRGPRTVGAVVEAEPRPFLDQWGGWPGASWFALETLVRYRSRDPGAALAVLETPQRGGETARVVLAARLASALGDATLARQVLAAGALGTRDLAVLRLRLQTLSATDAAQLWRTAMNAERETLGEPRLRELSMLAAELHLEAPVGLLDAAAPVGGGVLAYIRDVHGKDAAARLHTSDPVGYRTALAVRFSARAASLDPADIETWLDELWARGAAALPQRRLGVLGGIWPHAASWLSGFAVAERPAALAALRALPATAGIEALNGKLEAPAERERGRLLLARAALLGCEDAMALAMLDVMLEEQKQAPALDYRPVALPAPVAAGEEPWLQISEDGDSDTADPKLARLRAWHGVFADSKGAGAGAVRERFRAALEALREAGATSADSWNLALAVEDDPGRAAVIAELENAWTRGDVAAASVPAISASLARYAPAEVGRWMARAEETFTFDAVSRRARLWRDAGDPAAAAATLVSGRSRGGWSRTDEIRAFDLWRRLALPPGTKMPAAWSAAAPFWRKSAAGAAAGLGAHLAAHPYDVLSARAALRALDPLDADSIERVIGTLDDAAMNSLRDSDDNSVLRMRAARALLTSSPRAAARELAGTTAPALAAELARRGYRKADLDAALGDLARIGRGASDRNLEDGALAALADRDSAAAAALLAELGPIETEPPLPFVTAGNSARAYVPGDLTFELLGRIVAAETGSAKGVER